MSVIGTDQSPLPPPQLDVASRAVLCSLPVVTLAADCINATASTSARIILLFVSFYFQMLTVTFLPVMLFSGVLRPPVCVCGAIAASPVSDLPQ